jgi:hypothetical protein
MSLLATHAEVVGAGNLRAGAVGAVLSNLRFPQGELAKLKQSVEHAGLAPGMTGRDADVAQVWLKMAGSEASGLHLSLPTIVAALAAMVVVFGQHVEAAPVLALQELAEA